MSDLKHVLMGDSVTGDTTVYVKDRGHVEIQSLFTEQNMILLGGKEYCYPRIEVLSLDPRTKEVRFGKVSYLVRHLVSKPIYRVHTLESYVDVTSDHSVMTYSPDGEDWITETKPEDITQGTMGFIPDANHTGYILRRFVSVERQPDTTGFVYDIEVDDTHTFFANGILVHNTDSCYVSFSHHMETHGIEPTKENAVRLTDNLQRLLHNNLPDMLSKKFLTPADKIAILEPGREIVGRRALFKDKKKRYAIHVVDNEGRDADKLKIMGMETQRSDTPKFIQKFLKECLKKVVQEDEEYADLKPFVDQFRKEFRAMPDWEKGSPSRVRNLAAAESNFHKWLEELESGNAPGKRDTAYYAVTASINTNKLIEVYDEKRWNRINDGDKVEVIYLKKNPMRMDTVSILVGQSYVPDWFRELPFDVEKMEEKLLDRKLWNVIGDVLGWDFTPPATYVEEVMADIDDFYS